MYERHDHVLAARRRLGREAREQLSKDRPVARKRKYWNPYKPADVIMHVVHEERVCTLSWPTTPAAGLLDRRHTLSFHASNH
jgi:hypothetical protein